MSGSHVSIGVPVFNGARFLEAALQALVDQDHDDLQIIVCDNASTDDSFTIARAFAEADARVEVHRSEVNRGAARNFNWALDLARGSFFKWAAADDLCGPSFVRLCLERFGRHPGPVALCYPKTTVIDDEGAPEADFEDEFEILEDSPSGRLGHFLSVRTEYHPVFGLIRTDLLRRTRGIGSFVASDVVVLAELALQGRFLEVPERQFFRRFHEATSIRAHPDPDARAEWFDPARRGGALLPWSRLTYELSRSVARSDLPPAERARCQGVLIRRWALPYTRVIGGEVKAAARTQIRSALAQVRQ